MVIYRKVSGCFRSGKGARGYVAWKSLVDTEAFSKIVPFDVIQNLLGTPCTPIMGVSRYYLINENLFCIQNVETKVKFHYYQALIKFWC